MVDPPADYRLADYFPNPEEQRRYEIALRRLSMRPVSPARLAEHARLTHRLDDVRRALQEDPSVRAGSRQGPRTLPTPRPLPSRGHAPERGSMTPTPYRHAIWPASRQWREGYQYGAPLPEFKREFPRKVKELGPPLRVWDSPEAGFE